MRGVGAGCESLIWVFSEQLSRDAFYEPGGPGGVICLILFANDLIVAD